MSIADDETAPLSDAASNAAEPEEGQIIGRYRLERRLGGGGMGVVFRAVDTQLGRAVALKLISPALAGSATASARLLNEARAASTLDHPNVVAVYEVGEHRGMPFFAMALQEGESLKQRLERGPIDAVACARILIQIADALAAAHARNIVHRDVKPGNVMLAPDGQVKLVDFGVAKILDDAQQLTASGDLVGTLIYIAPEQHSRESVGPAADIWAVGVVGYEILSGQPPFPATSTVSLVDAVMHRDPPPLEAPADLETILFKCMAKDPRRRYLSAEALAADLRRFVAGEPIVGRRSSLGEKLRRRARRNRSALVVALVGVAGMLTLGGWLLASRQAAQGRMQRAQRLGQEVQLIRNQMRAAHLLPAHDVKPERDRVRAELDALAAQMAPLGKEGVGPGEYALGVGLFSLGERREARQHLEKAWAAGEREPELAYALGLALADAYAKEAQFRPKLDKQAAAERERRLTTELRDPALRYLRQAQGAADVSPAYVEALIALYERRWRDAVERAEAAARETPSLYEALVVAGDAYSHLEIGAWRAGDKVNAQELARRTQAAYEQALDVARSDDTIYLAYVDSLRDHTRALQDYLGSDGTAELRKGVELCERARRTNSQAAWIDAQEAEMLYFLADHAYDTKRDDKEDRERAVLLARRAVAQHPDVESSWAALTWALLLEARHGRADLGLDPVPLLRESAAAAEHAAKLAPDRPSNWVNFGVAHSEISNWQRAHGQDCTVESEAVVAAYEKAAALDPAVFYADFNACVELLNVANMLADAGRDPASYVARGHRHCEAARAAEPSLADPLAVDAALDTAQARYRFLQGGDDARAILDRALAQARKAAAMPTSQVGPHEILSDTLRLAVQLERAAGHDPRALMTEVLAEGRKTIPEGSPRRSSSFLEALAIDLRERLRTGRDTASAVATARGEAKRALGELREDLSAQLDLADLELVLAEAAARAHQSPGEAVRDGNVALSRVLAADPRAAHALAIRSRLQGLAGDAAGAQASLAAAIAANPYVRRDPALAP